MRALRTVAASAMIAQPRGGAQGQMSHRAVENFRQKSFRLNPAASNAFQFRHGAAEGGQSAGALALDESFQSLANQSRFLSCLLLQVHVHASTVLKNDVQ